MLQFRLLQPFTHHGLGWYVVGGLLVVEWSLECHLLLRGLALRPVAFLSSHDSVFADVIATNAITSFWDAEWL